MNTLDEAFAKAYGRPQELRKAASDGPSRSTRSEPPAEPPSSRDRQAVSAEPRPVSGPTLAERTTAASPPQRSRPRNRKKTTQPAGPAVRPTSAQCTVTPAVAPASVSFGSVSAKSLLGTPSSNQATAPAVASREPETEPAYLSAFSPLAAPSRPLVAARVEPPPAEAAEPVKRSESAAFRPLLEVDNFVWPKGVLRIVDAVEEPLEQLLTNLVTRSIRGQKVIAWQACRRGDGCTTLLLAAARRLAERDVKVVVVDADVRHPHLARHLGLMPSTGWEESLSGRLPLAEVLVESLDDKLAVLPWCASSAAADPESNSAGDPAESIQTLRDNYDLVLVDLGVAWKEDHVPSLLASERAWVDAVLLVHNVRRVPQADLNEVSGQLQQVGISDVAVIENFV
jgi:Mrp family chromosome partitioning ATPase